MICDGSGHCWTHPQAPISKGGLSQSSPLPAGHDLDALAVDGHGQGLCTRIDNGLLQAWAGLWLDQEHHAAASARSAYIARQRAIATRDVDEGVHSLCRDRGQISLAERLLFAHEPAG